MTQSGWLWPGNRRIAVVFNVCLEAWSDGNPPGMMLETFEDHLKRIAEQRVGPVIIDVTAHAHIFGRPHGAY